METLLASLFQTTHQMVFIAMGIFTRVAAMVFLLPGLGERGLSMRIKLVGALSISVLLLPLVKPMVALSPTDPVSLTMVLMAEALAGIVIGLAFRLLVYALQICGMVAAQHLSIAQMFGAGVAPEPEPTIATLMALGGITLALMAGLHVHVVATMVDYYEVFPFGRFLSGSDLATWATTRMAETFALGITLAAPFVAIGFTYNLALGALNRAMPQLLVALVGVPGLIWIGLIILAMVLPDLMDEWMGRMGLVFGDPLGGFR